MRDKGKFSGSLVWKGFFVLKKEKQKIKRLFSCFGCGCEGMRYQRADRVHFATMRGCYQHAENDRAGYGKDMSCWWHCRASDSHGCIKDVGAS